MSNLQDTSPPANKDGPAPKAEAGGERITGDTRPPATEEAAGEIAKQPQLSPKIWEKMEMMLWSVGAPRRPYHPLFEKFTEEHIERFLDHAHEENKRSLSLERSSRWFRLGYTIIGLAIFVFLVLYLLPNDKTLLYDIIKIVVAFLGGLGSGFGLKSRLGKQ